MEQSGGFNDFVGTETSCTDPDVFDSGFCLGLDPLKIGFPFLLGGLVRMAHAVSELGPLSAYFTYFWHFFSLFWLRNVIYSIFSLKIQDQILGNIFCCDVVRYNTWFAKRTQR